MVRPVEFIDDLHRVVDDDIVAVALVEGERRQRLDHQFLARAADLPQPVGPGQFGDSRAAGLAQPDMAEVVAQLVIDARAKPGRRVEGQTVERLVLPGAALGRDDQRRARLVDQHAVGLIDDAELQAAEQRRPRPPVAEGRH